MKLKQSILAAAMLMAAAAPMQAQAKTATASINVVATVQPAVTSGTVTANGSLDFGILKVGQTAIPKATTSFDVSVSLNVPYSISFGKGQHPYTQGGSPTLPGTPVFGMIGSTSGNLVGYSLYSNSSKATQYQPQLLDSITGQTGTGSPQNFTLYAEINSPAADILQAENLSDTITVTLTY